MKKKLLVLLMLVAFVGQVQGAEQNSVEIRTERAAPKRGQAQGNIIGAGVYINGGIKQQDGSFAPNELLDQTKAAIANRWGLNQTPAGERLDILKGWFPGQKALQNVGRLEIKEKEEEELPEAQVARQKAARDAEKAAKEALEVAERARIEKTKRAQEQLEEQKKKKADKEAQAQREAEEAARIAAEAEALRVAQQLQQAEELRLRLEAEELQIEQERVERERIAELARLEELEKARLAKLKLDEEQEQARLDEIEKARVEEEMALIQKKQAQQSKAEHDAANARRIAAVEEASKNRFKGLHMTCANCPNATSRSQCSDFNADPFCRIALRFDGTTDKYPLDFDDTFFLWKSGFGSVSEGATDAEFSPFFRLLYDCARGFYEDSKLEKWDKVQDRKLAYYQAAGIDAPELKSWAQKLPELMSELKKHGFTLQDLTTSFCTFEGGTSNIAKYFIKSGTVYEKDIFNNYDSNLYRYTSALTEEDLLLTSAGRDALALVAAQEQKEQAQAALAQLQINPAGAAAAAQDDGDGDDLAAEAEALAEEDARIAREEEEAAEAEALAEEDARIAREEEAAAEAAEALAAEAAVGRDED